MSGKISSKGQVTVPKEVRDAMGIKAGDSVDFVVTEGGQTLMKVAKKWTVDDLAGYFKDYASPSLPRKEVYRAQMQAAAVERDRRTKSKGR